MNIQKQRVLNGYLLLTPAVVFVGAVLVYPLLYLFWISLTDAAVYNIGNAKFVGLNNYFEIFRDPSFLHSCKLTLYFGVVDVAVQFVLGLAMAIAVHTRLKGTTRDLIIALFLLPAIIAPVVVGLFFRVMLNTEFGVINFFLESIGLPGPSWLAEPVWAFWSIVLSSAWTGAPMMFIVLLGGLLNLPIEPHEAADIDGASGFQKLCLVTIPMLKPVIVIALLLRTIDILKSFDKIFVLTGGGPGTATEVLNVHMYKAVFSTMELGYGSAMGVIVLFIVIGVSAAVSKLGTNA